MQAYDVTVALGAARMVDALPERAHTVLVIANSDDEAVSKALHLGRHHFNKKFKGQPILSKRMSLVDIKELTEDKQPTVRESVIAALKIERKHANKTAKKLADREKYYEAEQEHWYAKGLERAIKLLTLEE